MSLLQMTFSGAVLILVIVVIRAVAINRLPKKTFLILWGIVLLRLLIPYSVPSAFSVYTWVSPKTLVSGNHGSAADTIYTNHTETAMEKVPVHPLVNKISHVMEGASHEQTDKLVQQSANFEIAISITWIIWLAGIITIAIYFASSYLYWRFAFRFSLPIQNDFVEQWQKTHFKTPPVLIRQSDRIAAPLSYGIFYPVILMPKKTYANMLIDMEVRKSGLMPLCNHFSKNAIEERIIAIMKIKKTTVTTMLSAVILIVGVTAAFATSAMAASESATSADAKNNNTYFLDMPLLEIAARNNNMRNNNMQNVMEQSGDTAQEQETREYPNGTMEDYRSLLALKTSDYQKMSVTNFNMKLLDWANENYERMERIGIDTAYHDFAVDLTDEELSFVTVSVQFSGMENGAYVRSIYTGKPEADPAYGQYLPQKIKKQNGQSAWCDLYYQFSYHIADKNVITVEERDRSVRGMMEGITEFWNETSLEALLVMTEEDIVKALDKIAAENSNDKITITISEDQISFDCMNELGMKEEGYKTGFVDTDALRIREKASDSASVSGLLPKKQKVFILSEEKGFYHVFVPGDDGLDGWVRKEYVTIQ